MYNKKYRIEEIEELNGHNPIYDDVMGKVCYPAYFNVGERGWFLYETDDWFENHWFNSAHRIHTSIIKNVEYFDDQIFVETQNTKFVFKLISE